MENQKKALIYGSFGLGIALLLRGHRTAAMTLGGIALASLATEYPEQFENLWRETPEFIEKSSRIVNNVIELVDRLSNEGRLLKASSIN